MGVCCSSHTRRHGIQPNNVNIEDTDVRSTTDPKTFVAEYDVLNENNLRQCFGLEPIGELNQELLHLITNGRVSSLHHSTCV